MQIGRIQGTTRVIGKSQGYIGLPLRDIALKDPTDGKITPAMESAWLLAPDEMQALIDGRPLILRVLGTGHPPVNMYVDRSNDLVEPVKIPAKVRQLEWNEPGPRSNYCWTAECIIGTFSVVFEDGWSAMLEDGHKPWQWEPDQDPRSYHGPYVAMSACQEHFVSQVRSVLE